MENTEFIIKMLEKYIPDDVDILGQSNVKLIAMGNTNFAKPKFAQKMDVSASAHLAVEVVAFIYYVWAVFDKCVKEFKPTIDDLKKEMETSNEIKEIPAEIKPVLDEILIEITLHIKNKNP